MPIGPSLRRGGGPQARQKPLMLLLPGEYGPGGEEPAFFVEKFAESALFTGRVSLFFCNPGFLAEPKMLYDGNSPACTRLCKCSQASCSFIDRGSAKRYGVS
jgi:hypothetical protein